MDYSQIGKEIKLIRKTQGISQKDLSAGICTQAQISKIEKGEVHPLSSTLYLLAKRLGVDVNYFYQIGYAPQHEYIKEVEFQIRQLIKDYKYEEVFELIKLEKKNPMLKKLLDFHQFILWNEGICTYHIHKDAEKALQLLTEALQLTTFNRTTLSEREIEIMNSVAIIHDEMKDYPKAIKTFETALESYQKLTYTTSEKIFPRLCYNLSRSLTRNKDYQKSITISKQGINWCKTHQILYLLGELYFQLGLNFYKLEEHQQSKKYFNKSIVVLDLQDKQQLIDHVKRKFPI